MKRSYFLIILLFGIISCQKKEPKNVWIQSRNKALTSENGFSYFSKNSIMDFNKLERYHFAIPKDSTKKFLVDYKKKTIIIDSKFEFDYKLFEKDSLEIYYPEQNLTEVFIPLSLEKKLNLEKKEIEGKLINKKFNSINGDINFEFSNKFHANGNSIYYDKVKTNRILKTKYLKNKETTGYWYLGEKEKNFFLVLNFDDNEEFVYHILKFNENQININGINTSGISNKIQELKTSL
ncbi:hypothetical protein [Polaribacter marinivivus]|uniref:Lipoprotein n=1 Tax=Polaribacter marinivivus TaxID=1524260 RepID=A0ABV8R4F8_9FLAO